MSQYRLVYQIRGEEPYVFSFEASDIDKAIERLKHAKTSIIMSCRAGYAHLYEGESSLPSYSFSTRGSDYYPLDAFPNEPFTQEMREKAIDQAAESSALVISYLIRLEKQVRTFYPDAPPSEWLHS